MLDAAVEVFSRSGFHPASMDEIADAAGVSKPMIYTYLGSKDDLFSPRTPWWGPPRRCPTGVSSIRSRPQHRLMDLLWTGFGGLARGEHCTGRDRSTGS